MKTILCYGDSLTWGYDPETVGRYPFEQRWTGFLQHQLGAQYRILEEGLNGRNTNFDDPFNPHRNGSLTLPVLLEAHAPLDMVILFLGTNDLKQYTAGSAKLAALGCGKLIRLIRAAQTNLAAKASEILLLSPPVITNPLGLMQIAFENTEEESRRFSGYYRSVADFFKVNFLDTAEFLTPSPIDGTHLDVANNKVLAGKVAAKVSEVFSS